MAARTDKRAEALAGRDLEQAMAMVEKGQQLAGHFPDREALDRAEAILRGDLTYGQARAQILAMYANG